MVVRNFVFESKFNNHGSGGFQNVWRNQNKIFEQNNHKTQMYLNFVWVYSWASETGDSGIIDIFFF